MKVKTTGIEQPFAYHVDPFCRRMGIGRTHFYNLLKSGQIRTVLIGGRRVVPVSEVERLLSGVPLNTSAAA